MLKTITVKNKHRNRNLNNILIKSWLNHICFFFNYLKLIIAPKQVKHKIIAFNYNFAIHNIFTIITKIINTYRVFKRTSQKITVSKVSFCAYHYFHAV